MWKHWTALGATVGLLACASSIGTSPALDPPRLAASKCGDSPAENKAVVQAFYSEALLNRRPRAAFERYASSDFVEHKPDVEAGTREATIRFLEALIAAVPEPRWEIVRTIAEGDLVFLHASFSPAAGAPPYAIADVFRLRDCLIVEHWDVVAPPPQAQRNPNGRF